MTDRIAIALAQINPTVGAIAANIGRIRAARAEAAARSSDLVVCPQLAVTGCPLGDLATRSFFLDAVEAAVREFAGETSDGGPAVLLGAPWRSDGKVHDAALLLEAGAIAAVRFSHVAPAEGAAAFSVGPVPGPLNFRGVRFGVLVGDDISTPDVAEALSECGAELLVHFPPCPSRHALDRRIGVAVARVTEAGLPLLSINQTGGQDDLVFDGSSFALGADRALKAHGPAFREALLVTRWERDGERWTSREGELVAPPSGQDAIWQALTVGLRDYVNKNGFATVVLGLSGGLDSAVAAAVAVDALGPDRVRPVFLPSPITTRQSLNAAHEVAELLGCKLEKILIDPALKAFDTMLAPLVAGRDPDTTEENVQARVRAVTLLQLSNKFGALVLSSLNRSDLYAGYFTLSGDVSNGFAVFRDLYKTDIVALWPAGATGPCPRASTAPPAGSSRNTSSTVHPVPS